MKILKGILFTMLGMLALFSLFIILYAFSPGFADVVSGIASGEISSLAGAGKGGSGEGTPLIVPLRDRDAALLSEQSSDLLLDYTGGSAPATDYVPPEKISISTPEEVSGRSGYEPVQEESEEVDEEEGQKIRDQASYGETGDGLDFDTEFYPYYGMLDNGLQKIYRQIYANVNAANDMFTPVEQITVPQFKKAFIAVFNDHPELFWLDGAYQGKAMQDGSLVEVKLFFNKTAQNLDASKAAFNQAAEGILSAGRNAGSDYQKEVYVHNALLDKIVYELYAPLNQNAYSAMVNGETVCAGYARAFQYLMQQLGIPCYYCTGYAGESHAWNVIKLSGDYYNVDTTWDDTDPNTFDFFNKTDRDFAGTHMREELSVYLPACVGTAYGNLESSPEPYFEEPFVDPYADSGDDEIADTGNGGNSRREDSLLSLAEAGFSEEDVLKTMSAYYEDCYNQIVAAGGSMQFDSVINDLNMYYACSDAYSTRGYADGYGNRVMEELGAAFCEVSVSAEELSDGRILLHHSILIEW